MLVASDPETLDPRYVVDSVGMRTTRLVHAGLVRLAPDTLAPEPYVASSWRWIDPLTLRVELRDGVRFHSGAPVRAEDVAATLRAFASPQVASRHARVIEPIASAEPEGERALVVRLARPHATLLSDLEIPILRADQAASPPAPEGTLDGLGPYAVAHVARGEVLLVPADTGVLPRPSHALELRTVHDENARALRLQAGRADVAVNLVSPALLPALAGQPGLAVASRPGANLTYLVANEERAPLGDTRVRHAISLGIDRAMLCATLFDGRAHPAGGLIAPASWAHADVPPLPFDPAAARALLAQAMGVAAASRMHLTLLTSTERLRGDVARVVAQELADVGVEVEVVPLELGTMIARLNAGDFDLASLQLPEMTEPNVLRVFLHGRYVPPAGNNRGRVRDDTLDALLDEGDSVVDPQARRAIYARLEAHEREAMHLVPLWYEDQVVVTSERARAFLPSAEGRWLGVASLP
jgi:peptide/nickel transport system substrate-binding protein